MRLSRFSDPAPTAILAAALFTVLFPALGAVLGAASPLAAEVRGRVVDAAGSGVAGALVRSVEGSEVVDSAADGGFVLSEVDPPATIEVSHPDFLPLRVEVASGTAGDLALEPRPAIFEEVVVSAGRGGDQPPVSIAASAIDVADDPAQVTTVTELVTRAPGVAENGQGGIFQVYSIRGVSRQRVSTLLSGVRIVSDRRAGVSASFIDPSLLSTVEVVRGPASTYYGSGALGGVVQLFPRRFDGSAISLGYESQGDESVQSVGWGDGDWSIGLAHRSASRAEAPDGTVLNSDFSQFSGTLQKSWRAGSSELTLSIIGSDADDIGKDNTDFPENETRYPDESHWIIKLGLVDDRDWSLDLYAHPNRLVTRQVEPGVSETRVVNEALDLGLGWQQRLVERPRFALRAGVDYFTRRGVEAEETLTDLVDPTRSTGAQRTLDDATEDEVGLYLSADRRLERLKLGGGARLVWNRQQNAAGPAREATEWTAFGGASLPLGQGVELAANIGSGLRFPSLTERFFTGTTGRGQVEGNPELDPERSLSADLGLRWSGQRAHLAGYLFRNRIESYIERLELAPDELTFENLSDGTLEGIELEGSYQPHPYWLLTWTAHRVRGESAAGEPLADVPSDRVALGGRFDSPGPWSARLRLEHRLSKDDPGSGEKAIPSASLLSLAVGYALDNGLELRLSGRNLLDESYFGSADRKVQPAAGRSLGLALAWSGD